MNLRRISQFPPLEAIKKLDSLINESKTQTSGILNFESKTVFRPEIWAPFSIFSNTCGKVHYNIDGKKYCIENDGILIMNRGQVYDLMIESDEPIEILNAHINEDFLKNAYQTLVHKNEDLLDKNPNIQLFEFQSGIISKPSFFTPTLQKINHLNHLEETSDIDPLTQVIDHLFLANKTIQEKHNKIPATKQSVKLELYKRIATAKDYIWSYYNQDLDLEELSKIIGMSKFHFLRVFKSCYGITPYQFLSEIRIEKAKAKLKSSNMPIVTLATELGFEMDSSFIKFFKKKEQISPQRYREQSR